MQEEWLHLVDTARGDKNEVENCKKPKLERKGAVANLPESEAAEKSSKDMKNDLVPHVVL